MKFYTSVAKGLKLKVKRFWGLILTFVEVTGEKLVRGPFCPPNPPIINRVNDSHNSNFFIGQFPGQYGVAPQAHNQQVQSSSPLVFHTSQMGPTPQPQQQQYITPQHITQVQQPHATEPLQQNSQQQSKKKGTAIRLTDPNTGKDLTNEVFKHKEKTASSRHGGNVTSNTGDEEKKADVNAQFAYLVRYLDFVDQ